MVSVDRQSPHYPTLTGVVIQRVMLKTSIVPESYRTLLPAKVTADIRLNCVFHEIAKYRFRLLFGHAFDSDSEGFVDVKCFTSGFRMSSDNGVNSSLLGTPI